MAKITPFQAYRYSPAAGDPSLLVTQPYDKINREMQARYLASSEYNLVRIILGERFETDTAEDNVYTRAGKVFLDWIKASIIVKDPEPCFYAYFQQFEVPDTREILTRKGFIGLGKLEDYDARIVHRHEQTLSGPKKDRRQVLEHTKAHFGQIFMLYPDPDARIDAMLDQASRTTAALEVRDEYGTVHMLYRIAEREQIHEIQRVMSDKKLLIADGHHRYETALAFSKDNPGLADAQYVMMTFVNLHSRGLRVLATHRVLSGLESFEPQRFEEAAGERFRITRFDDPGTYKQFLEQPEPDTIRIGVVMKGRRGVTMLQRSRNRQLDVQVLHEELIEGALGISRDQVSNESFIRYIRGLENAASMVTGGEAQIAFLLEPTTIDQVADTSFGGGVMPQKSTDFYPKLLSGLTIYRLEK